MTSDPKAPGADAVYLDLEELYNDALKHESYYARIKVLTEKGKEMATVELPYLKEYMQIVNIKGRTIQPDGTIIPLSGKPDDLLSEKVGDEQIKRKVFTMPSVEVGSILEYRYTISYCGQEGGCFIDPPTWEIQKPHFVHKARFEFTPIPSLSPSHATESFTGFYSVVNRYGRIAVGIVYSKNLPPGAAVKAGATAYMLDLTDIPALPEEEWMPPLESLRYKVDFNYSYIHDSKQFWPDEGKLWSNGCGQVCRAIEGNS